MRLFVVLLAVFVSVVTAVSGAAPEAEVADHRDWKRLLGICILGISWLGDCNKPTSSSPAPTPTSTSFSNGATSSGTAPSSSSGSAPGSSVTPAPSVSGNATAEPSGTTFTPVDYHTYSYAQPSLPWKTCSAPASQFTVANGGFISSFATTRWYTFNIEYAAGAPDGFQRRVTTINGQFPGPLIEANQGDTVEITVNNRLDIPQSIHWHGMRHNGTNSEDGVPGISQCAIPPGGTYTYKFKFESEMGTYWYHSHYGNSLADGVVGGLIVHSRNDPLQKGRDYDEDRIIYLTDWMNDQSDLIISKLHDMTTGGFRGSPIMGPPDSVLINGVGQLDCSKAQKGVKCSQPAPHRIRERQNKRVRFRVIHCGSHALLRFSIDKHPLKVIEADDQAVQPFTTNEIPIWPGQRYSVVVTLDKGLIGESFYIRARNAAACIVPLEEVEGLAVLQYTSWLGLTWFGKDTPKHQPWGNLMDAKKEICHDLDHYHTLTPLVSNPPPAERKGYAIWESAFGQFQSNTDKPFIGFGLNGTTYTNYINDPLLTQIINGRELDKEHVPAITWNEYGAYDLVLNQHDPSPLAHPFHLHGRPFYILARGEGALTSETMQNVQLNTVNPPRRDVLSIAGSSWAILRIITDTPGIWPLHCHIGWHLAVGKLGVIVVRPDDIRKQRQSAQWHGLCAGTDPNAVGPGRRSIPEDEEEEDAIALAEADARLFSDGNRRRHRHKAMARRVLAGNEERQG